MKVRYVVVARLGNGDPLYKWATNLTKQAAERLLPVARKNGFKDARIMTMDEHKALVKTAKKRK